MFDLAFQSKLNIPHRNKVALFPNARFEVTLNSIVGLCFDHLVTQSSTRSSHQNSGFAAFRTPKGIFIRIQPQGMRGFTGPACEIAAE